MTSTITRTGNCHVKASKIDPVFQDFAVQEHTYDDGETLVEYWHKDLNKWVALPDKWAKKIVWDKIA